MKEPAMIGNLQYDDNDPTLKTLRQFIKKAPAKGKINALNDLLRVALMINSIDHDLIDKLNMLIKLRDKGTLVNNEFSTIFIRSLLENMKEPSISKQHSIKTVDKATPICSPVSSGVELSIDIDTDSDLKETDSLIDLGEPEVIIVHSLNEANSKVHTISHELTNERLESDALSESDQLLKHTPAKAVSVSDELALDNMMKLSQSWGENNQ
ncbi:hypothetical protein EIJ81_00605 (plasmid) [Aliivibrio salmonicida]|uniref:hypothetical protein n=1 Tax=Aliivibrio salmonicida TaxID=40269 RepID=UPI000F71CC25|nr:hypothetical protein [Aliivibrio salmonicida]AZL83399.1 hypothetical protein EIJ81_00605 [Aliivibrio salmonicida]